MEQKTTKMPSGMHGLPVSSRRNVELASNEHYEKMKIRSVKGLIENRNYIATLREISAYRKDGNAIIASIFAQSLNKVKNLTNVKNWMGLEGVEMFMDEVMDRYAKPDRYQIQLTPVDIQIFCRKIIVGEYGEMYENISVPKLISWLDQYVNERVSTIRAHRKNIEKKKRQKDERDTDPEGQRKIGAKYGEIHKKYLEKEASKQRAYLSIEEYIERNNIDVDEFWVQWDQEFVEYIENYEASSDSGLKIKDQGPETLSSLKRMFKNRWLTEKNKQLKK